jgi:two-component system OmpR family response regulator
MPTLVQTLSRPVAREASAEAPLRVLCVDDNVDAADSLGQILRLYGADVTVCHGGPEALAAVAGFEPDVAVLDVTMPEMDGCELARRLRERFGGRPLLIAALTALDGYAELSREVESGFDLHFTKPVSPGELVEALADYARHRE